MSEQQPKCEKINLGQDYTVLFWKSLFGTTNMIGPNYALRLNNSSVLESKHAFTCFENCTGDSKNFDKGKHVFFHPPTDYLQMLVTCSEMIVEKTTPQ